MRGRILLGAAVTALVVGVLVLACAGALWGGPS